MGVRDAESPLPDWIAAQIDTDRPPPSDLDELWVQRDRWAIRGMGVKSPTSPKRIVRGLDTCCQHFAFGWPNLGPVDDLHSNAIAKQGNVCLATTGKR